LKPLSYIQFLWNSDNAHGVHSPFIYHFVANGLYRRRITLPNADYPAKTPGLSRKALKNLHKTITYFKSYKLLVLGDDAAAVTQAIQQVAEKAQAKIWFCSPYADVPGGVDLAYISAAGAQSVTSLIERLTPDANNNTVLAMGNIHATAEAEAAWHAVKTNPNVRVTVDTYHLGLAFFRKEQQNQHFTIRTGTSMFVSAFLGIRNLWGLLG